MLYASVSDVLGQITEDELIQLTDDEAAGMVSVIRVEQALTDAGVVIDSYLESRFSVPFSPVPLIIKKLTVDIAIADFFMRKGIENSVRVRAELGAIAILKEISGSAAGLGDGQAVERDIASATKRVEERKFTDETMKNY